MKFRNRSLRAYCAETRARAELTALERDEQVALWVKLNAERIVTTGDNSKPGPKGAEREAAKELGLGRMSVNRAVAVLKVGVRVQRVQHVYKALDNAGDGGAVVFLAGHEDKAAFLGQHQPIIRDAGRAHFAPPCTNVASWASLIPSAISRAIQRRPSTRSLFSPGFRSN